MLGALVSEGISRALTTHNFYDEVLAQDGIVLVHVIPPRDLRSWQAYPVSAIANFRPVVIDDLAPENLRAVLEKNQFKRFPVLEDGKVVGCLTREEMQLAIEENRPPILEKVATCRRSFTIGEVARLLIEAPGGIRDFGSRRQTRRHHYPARPARARRKPLPPGARIEHHGDRSFGPDRSRPRFSSDTRVPSIISGS